jgi:PAS domain S-box-containing protein
MLKKTASQNGSALPARVSPHLPVKWILAVSFPLIALGLQWMLWRYISPYVWFLFYPAIFFSARVGGFWGGMTSTILSSVLVYYFFIPPQLSWNIQNPSNLFSIVVFLLMGYLLSDIQERFRQANRRTIEALDETRKANVKIQDLYDKTLELNELKAQFFANVSHELRTPLTLILTPIYKILKDAHISSDVRHNLEVAERNARFLHRHVNNLLDLSKLDAGHMQMHYAAFDLAQLARVTAAQFESMAAERGIHFHLEMPAALIAQADIEKCQHILLNLLSNAFKFTPDHGKISFKVALKDDFAAIQICDSGPGIPADNREAIFERFRQLDGSSNRKHSGTGLGLSIVKEYVSLHGGEIQVADAPEQGACFSVLLPVAAPLDAVVETAVLDVDIEPGKQLVDELLLEQAAARPETKIRSNLPLVLVVEDNPDMSDLIVSIFSQTYQVASAPDGKVGLEKTLALTPDLIIADLMMPNMSGDQMVVAIRERAEIRDIPIIVLTAKTDDATRVKLLQSGVRDFISKPFSAEVLLLKGRNLLEARWLERERLQSSELQYRNLFDNMVEGFAYCRMIFVDGQPTDWLYVKVNSAFENLTGLRDVAGKCVSEIIPGIRELDPTIFNVYARVALTGIPEKFETHLQSLDKWFSVSVYGPETGHFIAMFDSITERKLAEQKLSDSETKLQSILAASRDAIGVSKNGFHVFANPAYLKMFGYQAFDELADTPVINLIAPESREMVIKNIRDRANGLPAPSDYEAVALRKDDSSFIMDVRVSQYTLHAEAYTLVILRDITARKRAESLLRESQHRYQLVFENSGSANTIFDSKFQLIMQNSLSASLLHTLPEQGIGRSVVDIFGPDSGPGIVERMQRVMTSMTSETFETKFDLPVGVRWFRSVYEPIFDDQRSEVVVHVISQDITGQKVNEERIRKSLLEKETLLRELYHRTKNNMAVIIALLDLQANSFEDDRLRNEFLEAQNRIRSMALVHQKLYDAQDLSHINLKEYVHDLVHLTMESYRVSPELISVDFDMEDVFVLIDSAIPCGLIVNELVSNTLKYAFPAGRVGAIKVQLHSSDHGQIDLTIADNGVGVPDGFDFRRDGRLGVQNVYVLGERQLKGYIDFKTAQGVACHLSFQDLFYEARV